ncbi:MAG: radical SAM protein [Bacteroides sp.]|nr:radical SAM protein [Bacteroides sp.]
MSSTEGKRLKILVCKPRLAIQTIRLNRFIRCEPLELEYLYTVLQHHDVYLLDGIVDRRNPVRLASKLKSQIVLFTSLITTVSDVLYTASLLKNLPDPPKIFVGGPHAEVVPGDFFHKDIDGVFFANQLEGIVSVMDRIIQEESYADVPGGAFPVNGKFVPNPSPPLDPLKLPPVRHFLLEQNPNRYRIIYYKPCAAIKTSFGCTGGCTFCFCAQMHGGTYGARPIKDVVDEIEKLSVKSIFVLDDNFLHDRKRLLDFCELIRKRKLEKEFIIIGNAEFVCRNPDVMKNLRESGVKALMVGFEFVTDTELHAVNKNASLHDNNWTIEICRELDIDLFALFIIDPDWQHADFRRLASYLRDHHIPFALFSTLTVFPGTKLARLHPNPPGIKTKGWRYDLLRLHQKPAHMSKLLFYLWLFYLYMIPGKRFATLQKYRQRYGMLGIVKHSFLSLYTGFEYLFKLLIWK